MNSCHSQKYKCSSLFINPCYSQKYKCSSLFINSCYSRKYKCSSLFITWCYSQKYMCSSLFRLLLRVTHRNTNVAAYLISFGHDEKLRHSFASNFRPKAAMAISRTRTTSLPTPPLNISSHSRNNKDVFRSTIWTNEENYNNSVNRTLHDILRSSSNPTISSLHLTSSLEHLPNRSVNFNCARITREANNPVSQHQTQRINTPAAIEDLKTMTISTSRYKTELCRSFSEQGRCRYGAKCQYAHGDVELRPVGRQPEYKTEPCRTYHETGFCSYGPRCSFLHGSAERSALVPHPFAPESNSVTEEKIVQHVDYAAVLGYLGRYSFESTDRLPCESVVCGESLGNSLTSLTDSSPANSRTVSPSATLEGFGNELGAFPKCVLVWK